MLFSKKEMIEIGDLLRSWEEFDNSIHVNIIPDPRNGRKYTQVRRRSRYSKGKSIWYAKYVGPTDRYTPEQLQKAKEYIKQKHRHFINTELAKFNCKLEDFK